VKRPRLLPRILSAIPPFVAAVACGGSSDHGGSAAAADSVAPERAVWAPELHPDVREFRDCDGCPVMVELPPGRYLMGAPPGEEPAAANPRRPAWTEAAEQPQVEVEIAYRLAVGKYEVTVASRPAGATTPLPTMAGAAGAVPSFIWPDPTPSSTRPGWPT
jgi:hypothetical protein